MLTQSDQFHVGKGTGKFWFYLEKSTPDKKVLQI